MTKSGAGTKSGNAPSATRAQRLEAALRENLKKRKEQARARERSDDQSVPAASAPNASAPKGRTQT